MSLLMDKTLKEFSELLASSEPAPGGGSAAALSGLMAASLTLMVINLSVGKKSYSALEEDIKHAIEIDFQTISSLKNELENLVDEDTKAFNNFMEALKLPKESEAEKSIRQAAIHKAGLYTLEIPLLVSEKCLLLMRHQKRIALFGNKNAVSDIGVGVLLALAGLEGALLNVKINLQGITDIENKSEVTKKTETYMLEAVQLKSEIISIVNERMGQL